MTVGRAGERRARGRGANATGTQVPPRMELEMALEIIERGDISWTDAVRQAAIAAGGDLIFVLPAASEDGSLRHRAMVRLTEEESERLIVVAEEDGGYAVQEEPEIADDLLQFARASIEVLELMRADAAIVAPLASQH